MIIGVAGAIPVQLVEAAVALAIARNAVPFTEAHLVHAALDSELVGEVFASIGLEVDQVRDPLTARLGESAPPNIRIAQRTGGGTEIYRYGMVDRIEGQAVVLAATPQSHAVDALDVVMGAVFDPKSLISSAIALGANFDRDVFIESVVTLSGRYTAVEFPKTRLVLLGPPLIVPWSEQAEVLERAKTIVPSSAYWTYTKRGDELHLFLEANVDASLVAALRGPE